MNPIKLDLFRQYKGIGPILYNNAGDVAAFSLKTVDDAEDGYLNSLYIYDGEVKQMTYMGKEGGFIFDDDETLLFSAIRSSKDKKEAESGKDYSSFYRLNVKKGGEAKPAFSLPLYVSTIEKVADGKYVVSANIDATVGDFYKMSEEEKDKVIADRKKNADFNVLTEIPFWLNGIVPFTSKKRNRLFIFDEKDNSLEPITPLLFDCVNFEVIGGHVYACGKEYTLKRTLNYDVYDYDMASKSGKILFKNDMFTGHSQAIGKAGDHLLYRGADCSEYGMNTNVCFYEINKETGAIKLVAENDIDFYSCTSDGDSFYFNGLGRESDTCYRFDGEKIEEVYGFKGQMRSLAVRNGKLLFSGVSASSPDELYLYDMVSKQCTKLSTFHDEVLADKYVGEYEYINIPSHEWDVDGWVVKPINYDPSKKYPAILHIHGGPKGNFYGTYDHQSQFWASNGYFVFFCNPKGSDGRGNEFAEIRNLHGTVDYEDIMNFTDEVLRRYPQIDTEKLGVTGLSYGGYMTNWIIGNTDRFKAASSQCSVVNWTSLYGTSDISYDFVPDQMNGSPWEVQENYWQRSPLSHANNCKTPTLFIQPLNDYRCPLSEGLQMATALADNGCEIRVVTFAGDHHGVNLFSKPSHRERSFTETMTWMDKHLK